MKSVDDLHKEFLYGFLKSSTEETHGSFSNELRNSRGNFEANHGDVLMIFQNKYVEDFPTRIPGGFSNGNPWSNIDRNPG